MTARPVESARTHLDRELGQLELVIPPRGWWDDQLEEIARRDNNRARALALFRYSPDRVTGEALDRAAGRRFGARLHELNTTPFPTGLVGTGCRIRCIEQRLGASAYALVRDVEEVAP